MIYRLLVFLLCTSFSYMGIGFTLGGIEEIISCLMGDFCTWNKYDNPLLVSLPVILFCTAWLLYFLISYNWIRHKAVSKNLRILGGSIGSISIIITVGMGLLFVLPSVILMLYIHFRVPYAKAT